MTLLEELDKCTPIILDECCIKCRNQSFTYILWPYYDEALKQPWIVSMCEKCIISYAYIGLGEGSFKYQKLNEKDIFYLRVTRNL